MKFFIEVCLGVESPNAADTKLLDKYCRPYEVSFARPTNSKMVNLEIEIVDSDPVNAKNKFLMFKFGSMSKIST